LLATIVVNIV